MQFNDTIPVRRTNSLNRTFKILTSIAIFGLSFSLLLVRLVFVVSAAPASLPIPLATNTVEQDATSRFSFEINPAFPAAVPHAIDAAQLQTCSTYHFHNQLKNVGAAGSQKIADTTAPSAGSSTVEIEKPLSILGNNVEIARFYSDPILATDFVLIDDIVGTLWLQTTNFDNTNFTVEVFDYNPANGNTSLLGDLEFKIITDGQNEVILIITSPSVTIPIGHRFLFILHGKATILTQPTVTLFYNSLSRDSRFSLCQITPPQLTITKNAPAAVVAGHPITYTLTISNSGGLTATNLTISDTIPTNATYVSGGTRNGNVVTWSVASLAPNSIISKTFVVTATGTITNTNYQVAANGNIFALGQNNVVTVVSPPGQPYLTISKSGPATVSAGGLITYTLSVVNEGDTTALNLVISDTIPAGATYISGGVKLGNIVLWNAISLTAEASLNFNFVVTATHPITNNDYRVVANGGNSRRN